MRNPRSGWEEREVAKAVWGVCVWWRVEERMDGGLRISMAHGTNGGR